MNQRRTQWGVGWGAVPPEVCRYISVRRYIGKSSYALGKGRSWWVEGLVLGVNKVKCVLWWGVWYGPADGVSVASPPPTLFENLKVCRQKNLGQPFFGLAMSVHRRPPCPRVRENLGTPLAPTSSC